MVVVDLKFAVSSAGPARDSLWSEDLRRPEGHLASVVVQHRVRGVGTRGDGGLRTTVPGAVVSQKQVHVSLKVCT